MRKSIIHPQGDDSGHCSGGGGPRLNMTYLNSLLSTVDCYEGKQKQRTDQEF